MKPALRVKPGISGLRDAMTGREYLAGAVFSPAEIPPHMIHQFEPIEDATPKVVAIHPEPLTPLKKKH